MSAPRVLVLDGGSSAGTTPAARELQRLLDGARLRLGVDEMGPGSGAIRWSPPSGRAGEATG